MSTLQKLNRDAKQGTSVYSRTTRLKNNQVRRPKKSYKPSRRKKRRQGCCSCCEKRCHSWVVSRKTQSHQNFRKNKVSGKPTLRQASIRENTGPSLGKMQVKIPHQRSLYAIKYEDRSQEETERQERCAAARHGILPEMFTSSNKRTKLHSTHPRKNGYCRLHQQQSRRKESSW